MPDEPNLSYRRGPDSVSLTCHGTAPSLGEALETVLDELEAADPCWEPWRVNCWRAIRGRRASLEITWLHCDEVARRKASRGQKG